MLTVVQAHNLVREFLASILLKHSTPSKTISVVREEGERMIMIYNTFIQSISGGTMVTR